MQLSRWTSRQELAICGLHWVNDLARLHTNVLKTAVGVILYEHCQWQQASPSIAQRPGWWWPGWQQMQDSVSEEQACLLVFSIESYCRTPTSWSAHYPFHRCKWNILETRYKAGSFGINIHSDTEWELSHLGKYEMSGELFLSFALLNKVFQHKDE